MLSVGKRYTCGTCGTQILVTKPGNDAEPTCCGAPLTVEEPKKVASSD
jgi:hypothetical protein